jgi:hypothetical protein
MSSYTYTDNQYPETVPSMWHQQEFVKWDKMVDKTWNRLNFRSKRTDRPMPKLPILQQKNKPGQPNVDTHELLDPRVPRSREYFHNYDVIDGRGSWGRCLCEIHFYSGERCVFFVSSDDSGKAQVWKENKATDVNTGGGGSSRAKGVKPDSYNHWAWYIEVAPRGEVCPIAKQRFMASLGNPAETDIPCPIYIPNAVPYESWVLAQNPGVPPYTRPPRIDRYLEPELDNSLAGYCPHCRLKLHEAAGTKKCPESVTSDNQWIKAVEGERYKFETHQNGVIQPYIYEPVYEPDKVIPAHPSLVPGLYYHEEDFDLLETQLGIRIPLTDRVMELAWDLNNEAVPQISVADLEERNKKIQQKIDDDAMATAASVFQEAAHEEATEVAAALAASKDHGQWH